MWSMGCPSSKQRALEVLSVPHLLVIYSAGGQCLIMHGWSSWVKSQWWDSAWLFFFTYKVIMTLNENVQRMTSWTEQNASGSWSQKISQKWFFCPCVATSTFFWKNLVWFKQKSESIRVKVQMATIRHWICQPPLFLLFEVVNSHTYVAQSVWNKNTAFVGILRKAAELVFIPLM